MPDPESIAVPNVVGLTQAAAEAKLKSTGLAVGTVTTGSSATDPVGCVISTNPDAGTSASSGSLVNLEVSGGPAEVAVPNVVGSTQAAAETMLRPSTGEKVRWWIQYILPIIFSVLSIIVLVIIGFVIFERSGASLGRLANKDVARGLITFLIAITTVGIAVILALSTIVLTGGVEDDKRFDRGKQVLTMLIGVLGTIVGFYFGSAPDTVTSRQTTTATITTTALPDGTANNPYPGATLQTTGLTPPLKWSVKPALPAGLMLDDVAGTISGRPTAALPKTPFTFTVTDSAIPAASATANLQLEIK